jgi:hypothetical protein
MCLPFLNLFVWYDALLRGWCVAYIGDASDNFCLARSLIVAGCKASSWMDVYLRLDRWSDSHPRSPTARLKSLKNLDKDGYQSENRAVSPQRNCWIDETSLAVVSQIPNQVSEVPWSAGVSDKSESRRDNCVTSGVKFIFREWGQSACVFYWRF